MKQFFISLLATITGIFISILLFFFIGIAILAFMLNTTKNKSVDVLPHSILHIQIDYPIKDRSSGNPLTHFDFGTMTPKTQLGLYEILQCVEKAKNDSNIRGIYLDMSFIPTGYATMQELRNALLDFKKDGKFIVSYSEMYTTGAYYLASAGDMIYLHPRGFLFFSGLQGKAAYFKGLMEKAGIEAQVFLGKENIYKSATEIFTRDKMSEESRLQAMNYSQAIWNNMLKEISAERGISVSNLNAYANSMRLVAHEGLISNGLIDGFMYKDELIDDLKALSGLGEKEKWRTIKIERYYYSTKKAVKTKKDKIALIFASGEMVPGKSGEDENRMGADDISAMIRKARKDSMVRAIVLRINSGGGSALAADIIWREVSLAAATKPVVASFGDVAGSGAYYMATPASLIVAQPNSLTGSIGVFGILFNVRKLFNDKLGITFDGIKTNTYADLFSIDRPLNEGEKALFDETIQNTYETFISRVASGRRISNEQVHTIARGRVWDAVSAKDTGLIDTLGSLQTAIAIAAEKAGITEYSIDELPKQKTFTSELLKNFAENVSMQLLNKLHSEIYENYRRIKYFSGMQGIQARMVEEITFY